MTKLASLLVAASVALGSLVAAAGPAAAHHGYDLDCGDFTWFEDAVEHLRAHPGDPDGLDGNDDGVPCESRPRRPMAPPPPTAPVGDVFTDVLRGEAHTSAIEAMADAGVIAGYADGRFRPGEDVSRGQMAALLFRAGDWPAGTATFSDTVGTTHQAAIGALASAGVVGGVGDGAFRPDAPISRAQMATMISRAFRLPTPSGPAPFSDVAGGAHAAGISALAAAGITSGYADGSFRPAQSTPRGQTASFLHRALQRGTPGPRTAGGWTVTAVVDGDTVDVTSPRGVVERVRVIGIDTPEQGQCGFIEAGDAMRALALDQQVTLVAGAQDDRDGYGRLLRYLDVRGRDAGLELIRGGFAIARYDSRDGYAAHPREAAYVAADAASPAFC